MKKIVILVLWLLWSSTAAVAISLRVCQADSNTPLDSNTPIMAGTKLKIICGSDTAVRYAALGLVIADANQNFGKLYARGPLVGADWTGSHFPAAGGGAQVIDCPTDAHGNPVNELDMYADASAGALGAFPAKGDWFIIDYNATGIGNCTVKFYIYQLFDANNIELINPFNNPQVQSITFTQVASRDFNHDGRVDFSDFAILASYWLRNDCNALNNCDGTDLNADGKIDFVDVMYFAEYWLGSYMPQGSGGGMNMAADESSSTQSMDSLSAVSGSLANLSVTPSSSAMTGSISTVGQQSMMEESQLPPIYLTCDNNTPDPNTIVTIYVHSDAPLLCMNTTITVTGNAIITDAMKEADCNQYGWDHGWNSDPYIDDANGLAMIMGVRWAADANGTIGYFKLRYNSGQVSISFITEDDWSEAFGWDHEAGTCPSVPFSTAALVFGRDPNQP